MEKNDKTKLLFFCGSYELIYQLESFIAGDHIFQLAQLCIPYPIVQNILQISQD